MKHPVVFRRAAAKQVEEAYAWWRDNRLAAPHAIREEIERAVGLISVQPRIGALATNARLPGVRRLLLSRVSYWLYYREGTERIDVLAFWHARRDAGPMLR